MRPQPAWSGGRPSRGGHACAGARGAGPRAYLPGLYAQDGSGTQGELRVRSPFVGRTHELATLHAVLAQVVGGRGQAVGIVGEPGIGKSRLLLEWHQQLHAHGVAYLEGHCLSYGSAMPYLPVLDLLRAHCGITQPPTAMMPSPRRCAVGSRWWG